MPCGQVAQYQTRQKWAAPRRAAVRTTVRANPRRPRVARMQSARFRQADLNDCGACVAVGEDARRDCVAHCDQFDDDSWEKQACFTDCEVAAREHYHNTCVGLGRCPEVLCPRPPPPPTPCEACKLDCAAVTAAGEAECQDLEGAQYTRCKNEWQLRKYDCIENNCFASKVCCDWQPTQPVEDWEGTLPIEDDGLPTEPYDPDEPVGTYPEPYEPEEPIGIYPDPDGPIDEIEQLARNRRARNAIATRYNRPRYGAYASSRPGRTVRLGAGRF